MMRTGASIGQILLVLIIAGYAAAQAQPGGSTVDAMALDNLRSARSLWQSSDTASYVMQLFKTCFCPLEATGPFLVTVEDGAVTDVQFAPGGPTGTPSPDIVKGIPTVEGLFDVIEEALLAKAEVVNVNYDETTGAPVSFFIDRSSMIFDEEIGYTIKFVSGVPDTRLERLEEARELWTETRPNPYSVRISVSSFLGFESFILKVEGDTVVSAEYAPDSPVPPGTTVPTEAVPPTVDEIFAEIESALRSGADVVIVSYNPTTGVPESVSITPNLLAQDGGVGYTVQLL